MIPTVRDIEGVAGKRVLVRVDWNVPLEGGEVRDDFRIKQSLPTINFLREAGAKVVLMTHIESKETDSLQAVFEKAREFLPELTFIEESNLYLLENLRRDEGEKNNDEAFAKSLAAKGDVYVNEAFSVSHRAHASVVGVPKFLPGFVGLEFASEVENLSKAFNPPHPFLFILGGAKFETKLPLVKKFLDIADNIFIAGKNAKEASEQGFAQYEKISFPIGDIGALDFGPDKMEHCAVEIKQANFIVWNGPLGKYEDGYTKGTLALARLLADSGKEVIVGGADTLAAIKALGLFEKFTFVSTAGGAMLDFLANETLPGIEALKR